MQYRFRGFDTLANARGSTNRMVEQLDAAAASLSRPSQDTRKRFRQAHCVRCSTNPYDGGVFKPNPKVVAALRERLGDKAVDDALSLAKPDLTPLLLAAAAEPAPLPRDLLAALCRAGCTLLSKRHPGASIEVRVPPFAAVQVGFATGPQHRRGTPPNTVEMSPETFAALATGRVSWAEATLSVSGVHADEVAQAFPLTAP